MIAKLVLLFQLLSLFSLVSSEKMVFEIKKQNSQTDLKSMISLWDQQLSLFQKYDSSDTTKQSHSIRNRKQSRQNENSVVHHFNKKFLSHLNLNEKAENTTHPDHGNYTSFSLYTTYGNAYLVDIYVGSEKLEYQVLLDTGSSYTWLTHSSCQTCESIGINKFFDCEHSTTCGNQHETIEITYGKGVVNATVYRDSIGFAHNRFIANNQDFLLVTQIKDLEFFPGHGIFGLGFNIMSDGRKTILDNLKEQGQISKRQFAFSLSGDAEEVNFGQTSKDFFILGGDSVDPNLADDSDFFTCPCSFHPYWSVIVSKVTPIISDVEIDLHFQSQQAIIDSGTSFIVFNQDDFEVLVKFFKKLKKLDCSIDEKYNLLKCSATDYTVYPIFKLTLCEQSRHILVYPSQYLLCDDTVCYIRITGMNLGFGMDKVIILGDIFLRTQYTVFNQDDQTISFYKKKSSTSGDEQPPAFKQINLDTSLEFKNSNVIAKFSQENSPKYQATTNFKKEISHKRHQSKQP